MLVGIDTGGTYTDAVLFDPSGPAGESITGTLLATAKARTHPDLSIGIKEALTEVVADPASVSLVALSTTLATNALVEGVGGRVATVLVGFDEASEQRAGLAEAVGADPVIRIGGGHNSMGAEIEPLDVAALREAFDQGNLDVEVDAFAVAAMFSVRNPAHENAVKGVLSELTNKPVACSHELSARLNGPKRALTCLLNARLLGLIDELGQATIRSMDELGIDAPLMLVRGDGSLVSAAFAMNRPIETILSGPAASLVGANYLISQELASKRADAVASPDSGAGPLIVSDIGGTTTDIGIVYRGVPRIAADGAVVGGHQTMVEAVDMFTIGLGGDSELKLDRGIPADLQLGPRRVTPVSLAAVDDPEIVHATLDSRTAPFREIDTVFARATGRTGTVGNRERKVLDRLVERQGRWAPATEVAASSADASSLGSLVRRGLAQRAGFTPSDAAHVLGLHNSWDRQAAVKAADLIAAMTDGRGDPVRPDGKALAQWVFERLIQQSASAITEAALSADGYPAGSAEHELARRSLNSRMAVHAPNTEAGTETDSTPVIEDEPLPAVSAVSVGVATPVVALGASASTYYPDIAGALGTTSIVPTHADVANAVGAVVGQVRLRAQCTISQPSKGQHRIHWPGLEDRGDLQPAIDDALSALRQHLTQQANEAGAAETAFTEDVSIKSATVDSREVFVEATITVTATGRPRLG